MDLIDVKKSNVLIKILTRIPLRMLLQNITSAELSDIWHLLPQEYQENFQLTQHLPCTEHYNISGDQWDGPPQPKSTCFLCINKYK